MKAELTEQEITERLLDLIQRAVEQHHEKGLLAEQDDGSFTILTHCSLRCHACHARRMLRKYGLWPRDDETTIGPSPQREAVRP